MHNDEFEDDTLGEDLEPSKTQRKKDMLALQALGEELSKLKPEQRAQLPIGEKLAKALDEVPRIKGYSAQKRHRQFIGKLMRSEDADAIVDVLEKFREASHRATQLQHVVEHWRDSLIEREDAFEEFLSAFPDVERQPLRQLIRSARAEREKKAAPSHARKLFRFLRDHLDRAE